MIHKPIRENNGSNIKTAKRIFRRLYLGILIILPATLTYAQLWSCPENNTFLAGQSPARISRLEITNISDKPWTSRTVIEIELPKDFQAEWDITNTKVYRGNTTLKPTLQVVKNRIIKISGLRRVPTYDGITIEDLTIKNFRGSSPFQPLQIRINGEAARLVSNLKVYKRWGKKPTSNRYLKPFVSSYRFLVSHLTNTSPLATLINKSKAKGYFRIASLRGGLKTNTSFITGATTCELPQVIIRNDSVKSILNKNTILDIHFPTGLMLKEAPLQITPQKRVRYEYKNNNTIRIIIDKKIKPDDKIRLTGILAKSGKKVIPPRSLTLDWKKTAKEAPKKIPLENTIQVGNPAVKVADDIELVANTGEKTIPAVTIRENSRVTALLPGKIIALKIPGNIKARWSRNTKELKTSGTAARKIKKKPRFVDDKTLTFEVASAWKPNDFLKISGLKISAIKRTPEDIQQKKMVLHRPLMVLFDKPENKATRFTKNQIKIVEVDMSSLTQQVLLPNDEYEVMNPVSISIRSDFPTLRRGDELKLQFSKSLQVKWFLGLNKVEISGKSKNKVSKKVSFDFNKTPPQLILNIKDDFTGNEEFTIHNLLLQAKNPSRGSLKLFLNKNMTPMAVDSNNWLVQYPIFTSQESQ